MFFGATLKILPAEAFLDPSMLSIAHARRRSHSFDVSE
jgi:hypothetical protein